mmetsp:Transcript_5177/g.15798  ORF Transcript_5177/g.15798 Transcript_5177/m.15798 type:complete len:318 (-) Transcript_5177:1549-2502(-)
MGSLDKLPAAPLCGTSPPSVSNAHLSFRCVATMGRAAIRCFSRRDRCRGSTNGAEALPSPLLGWISPPPPSSPALPTFRNRSRPYNGGRPGSLIAAAHSCKPWRYAASNIAASSSDPHSRGLAKVVPVSRDLLSLPSPSSVPRPSSSSLFASSAASSPPFSSIDGNIIGRPTRPLRIGARKSAHPPSRSHSSILVSPSTPSAVSIPSGKWADTSICSAFASPFAPADVRSVTSTSGTTSSTAALNRRRSINVANKCAARELIFAASHPSYLEGTRIAGSGDASKVSPAPAAVPNLRKCHNLHDFSLKLVADFSSPGM